MKGILPEVSKIIITALGLDADSQTTTISWENYVVLYCMLEKSTYKDDGVKYWCTFFDPKGIGSVEEKDYMNLLEMMVRGKSYENSNHFTCLYADKIKQIFDKHNCLGFENELIISKFERAMKKGSINEICFSSALGNRELVLIE